MGEFKRRTWLEIRVQRELNKNALVPASHEQVEEEVARRKAEIEKGKKFEKEVFDLEYANFVIASKAKLN